ncbi:hypothetical protein [Allokutzneria sp. NRRL B-24872]|uniref:hypothetical protein n=1 Tax=Allokutzneria sp. NRRL B-24872 TaxID=1137961 RepID=UPI000A3C1703|nr:hypothetical protein [Allokutzneria sp. NRRL B-24872]
MKTFSVIGALAAILCVLNAPDARAADANGCTISMNSAKTGTSGTCSGHGIKKFRLHVDCVTSDAGPVTVVSTDLIKAGTKASVTCPKGKKIWFNKHAGTSGAYSYGYVLTY